jgi:hypothetical protein
LKGAPWKRGKGARHGNFKADTSVGLLMARYAMERCKEAGVRRWKRAENARYSDLLCLLCERCNTGFSLLVAS